MDYLYRRSQPGVGTTSFETDRGSVSMALEFRRWHRKLQLDRVDRVRTNGHFCDLRAGGVPRSSRILSPVRRKYILGTTLG